MWFWVGLCVAAPAWADEAAPEAAVAIPEVDIVDSVRRMLEAARLEQGETEPQQPVAAPAVTPAAVVPAAPVTAPPPAAPPPAAPQAAQPAPPPPPSGHVQLPAREITIRGLDDIRELARELDEAKQRQRRQE